MVQSIEGEKMGSCEVERNSPGNLTASQVLNFLSSGILPVTHSL